MCNNCGNISCGGCQQCFPSVPNQWPTSCPPSPCAPIPCPCPPVGLNLMFARVATTNLEFFNMPTTPKILIAAPGPGKLIVPLNIWNAITVSNPAAPYADGIGVPSLVMNLGTFGILLDSSILGAVADQTTYYAPFSGTVSNNLANQALTLSTISQPIVGDSVLYSYIIYTIVNI